jgi:hypothetical protein
MPIKKSDLPSTLQRSSAKAQRTFAETLENAEKTYGSGQRAARVAYASLKHSFEKVGDRWVPKKEKGPSDAQAAKGGAAARRGGKTHGGVDTQGNTRKELYDRARKLGVTGASRLKKDELADEIAKKQRNLDARERRKKKNG